MKKFFLIVLIILPTLLTAQNGIRISNFAMASGSVTFDLSWDAAEMPTMWSDSVWVFADYNKAGVMTRLPLVAGATLTATSAPGVGQVIAVPGNTQGVWVIGNARTAGNFSASVVLPSSVSNVLGACAYASNYLPTGTWGANGVLTMTGTPLYFMKIDGPSGTSTVTSNSPYRLPEGSTLLSFTDATGAPGKINCIPPQAPTNLTVSAATVCGGASVVLTATGGDNGAVSEFEWGTGTAGSGILGRSTANTYTVNPTAMTTYWVRRVSTENCGTTTAATITVAVQAAPTVTATKGGAICGSGTVSITATPSTGAVIDWYTAATGGTSVTTSNTYTIPNISTSTTYYAEARDIAANCVSASRTAVLASVNTVPVTPVITQPQSVCRGTDLVFTIDSPLTGGSYSWTGSVGAASGAGGVTYTASGATTGAKTVTVNVTIAANGITCTSLESEKVSATVDNLPTIATTVNGARCGTGAVLISATPRGGAEIDWYADRSGGTALTTASNTYTTPRINTSTTYYAAARVGSCISAARTAVLATVNTIPTINTQPASQEICPGSTVSLSVTASGATAYQWKNGAGNASGTGTTAAAFTGTVSVNSIFTVVVTGAAGCSVTSTPALVTMKTSGCCDAPGATPIPIAAFNPCQVSASSASTWTVIDSRDNKQYKVVKMPDNRIWFAQNLNYKTGLYFNDYSVQAHGEPFFSVNNGVPAIGSYWCPGANNTIINEDEDLCNIYGALYTWETAMMVDGKWSSEAKNSSAWSESWLTGNYSKGANAARGDVVSNGGGRGICPTGWHVPTDYEWAVMLNGVDNSTAFTDPPTSSYFGNNQPNQKLKSTAVYTGTDPGNGEWLNASAKGSNASGFNAVPGGHRGHDGAKYINRGRNAYFWTSSAYNIVFAYRLSLAYNNNQVNSNVDNRSYGYSVRCIQD